MEKQLNPVRLHFFCSRVRKQTAVPAPALGRLGFDRRAQLCNDRPQKAIVNFDVFYLEHARSHLDHFLDCACSLWQAQRARVDRFSTRSLQATVHWLDLPPNPLSARRTAGIVIAYRHRSFDGPWIKNRPKMHQACRSAIIEATYGGMDQSSGLAFCECPAILDVALMS